MTTAFISFRDGIRSVFRLTAAPRVDPRTGAVNAKQSGKRPINIQTLFVIVTARFE